MRQMLWFQLGMVSALILGRFGSVVLCTVSSTVMLVSHVCGLGRRGLCCGSVERCCGGVVRLVSVWWALPWLGCHLPGCWARHKYRQMWGSKGLCWLLCASLSIPWRMGHCMGLDAWVSALLLTLCYEQLP